MEENKKRVKWVEAHELPNETKVYLKKDLFGYRVVEPWKNEDGKINWFNFLLGGKRNLFILGVIFIVLLLAYYGFNEAIAVYKDTAKNPCNYCPAGRGTSVILVKTNYSLNQSVDLSEFNVSIKK